MDPNADNQIKLAAINANSIGSFKSRYDLQTFIDSYAIDICLISETKLNSKHKLHLPNHQLIRTDRQNATKGGGTAIAIHRKFKFTTIHYPNSHKNKAIEYTAIKIRTDQKSCLFIFSIYATQSTGHTFINELHNLMTSFNLDNCTNYYIIAGDLNAKSTTWGDNNSNERGDQLIDWLEDNYLQFKSTLLSPNKPTYTRLNYESYLDHCLIDLRIEVNNLSNGKLTTLPYDSDHNAITLTFSVDKAAHDFMMDQDNSAINFKKANWRKFNKHLLKTYHDEIKIPSDRNLTVDEIDGFISQLEFIINESIKATIPKIRRQDDYFLKYKNNNIKKLHALKSFLIRRQFDNIAISLQEKCRIKSNINRINKLLQNEFQKTVTKYWEAQIKSIDYRNSKEFFPKINRLLRPRKEISINTLKIPVDNSELSNHLNTKFPELISNNILTASDSDTKLYIIGKYLESINSPRYSNLGTFNKELVDETADKIKARKGKMSEKKQTFVTFSKENPAHYPTRQQAEDEYMFSYIEVQMVLKKLKNKTSFGLDNIPTVVLKNLPAEVIRDYTTLFNNSINNAYYPKRWKAAKVLPIPKKGKNPEAPQSYRPISLTMSISKIFERMIKKQMDRIISDKKIIPNNQFGFRSKHATTHALNKFLSDVINNIHDDMIVGAVLLDLEKAFDSVWINGLIYVLNSCKFPMGLIFMLIDMISGNYFYTWDGLSLSSDRFLIVEGLQQGRVLSPILFNIFDKGTNEAADLETDGVKSNSYADDRVIYVADNQVDTITYKLQDRVNKINNHYLDWNLKINPLKSEVIFFRRPCNEVKRSQFNKIKTLKITITDRNGQSTEIPVKKEVKYLGVVIDYLLHMTNHHKNQLVKSRNAIKSNARIFYNKNLSTKAKLICYQLLIRPLITYAAPMLWNMGPWVMEKYRRLERSALRSCISMHRKAETGYHERISNAKIYNTANITRVDCFYLKLCRNYFASFLNINNPIMEQLACPDDITCESHCRSGYVTPEMFIYCDRQGLLQNEMNVPIIYHENRHCFNKQIKLNHHDFERPIHSTALPKIDINDKHRLSKDYWWLQNNAIHIDEIRRRTYWDQ